MARDGKLQLDLFDVHGKRLGEKVDINLRHQVLSDNPVVSVSAAKQIKIRNLHGAPQGLYRIEIDPPCYFPVSQFVNLKASDSTPLQITFPIDPKKVKKVTFPKFADLSVDCQNVLEKSDDVFGFPGMKGKDLYASL